MPPAETTATTPAVDADGPDATPPPIAPPGPAGPGVPDPTGPSIEIPDPGLSPGEAALALLNALKPDAPSLLAGRIEGLARQLDDQVEDYRLNLKGSFGDFLLHAGRKVKLRRALEARAGKPAVGSAAAEVLGLIRSVRRFRSAEELKREREKRIASARAELAEVERKVQAEARIARTAPDGSVGHPDPKAEQEGFSSHHDVLLIRLEAALKQRQSIRDRLKKLDPLGDDRRGELVRQAIESAGGETAVVAALSLSPAVTAESEGALQKLRADIDGIAGRLGGIDDESRLAGELKKTLESMQEKIPGLQWRAGEERKAAAGSMVQDAVTGDLAAVRALLAAVAPKLPALAEALEALRGGDDDLVAVVEELIS